MLPLGGADLTDFLLPLSALLSRSQPREQRQGRPWGYLHQLGVVVQRQQVAPVLLPGPLPLLLLLLIVSGKPLSIDSGGLWVGVSPRRRRAGGAAPAACGRLGAPAPVLLLQAAPAG